MIELEEDVGFSKQRDFCPDDGLPLAFSREFSDLCVSSTRIISELDARYLYTVKCESMKIRLEFSGMSLTR